MIGFLRSWIINIVALVMMIVLLEIMVPTGKIKKFVNLVSGFILIIAIINPVLSVLRSGVSLEELSISTSNFLDKKNIEESSKLLEEKQIKQIAQTYRSKLIKQIEEGTKDIKGVSHVKADIIINEDYTSENFGQVKRVYVNLGVKEDENQVKPVAQIDRVRIKVGSKEENNLVKKDSLISEEMKTQIENKIIKMFEVTRESVVISLQEN